MYIIFPKIVHILLPINFYASFVFLRLFYVLLLEQLVDMLEVFMKIPVLPQTSPTYQQAAPTYCAQFGPLYIFYTEESPLAVLNARVQYIKQTQLLYSQMMGQ